MNKQVIHIQAGEVYITRDRGNGVVLRKSAHGYKVTKVLSWETRAMGSKHAREIANMQAKLHNVRIGLNKVRPEALKQEVLRHMQSSRSNDVKHTLFQLAQAGSGRYRSMIYQVLQGEIHDIKRARQMQQTLQASNHTQPDQTQQAHQTQQVVQSRATVQQVQPLPDQQIARIQAKQNDLQNQIDQLIAQSVRQITQSTPRQAHGPCQSQTQKIDLTQSHEDILAIARRSMRYPEINSLAAVKVTAFRHHQIVNADLYNDLAHLISKNSDVSAISLVAALCIHKNAHCHRAMGVLSDYIDENAFKGLCRYVVSCGLKESSNVATLESKKSIVVKLPVAPEILAERHDHMANGSTAVSSGVDDHPTVLPQLSDRSTVSPSSPMEVTTTTDGSLQIWQLSAEEKELQSTYFGLQNGNDTVRCIYCLKDGHIAASCPSAATGVAQGKCDQPDDVGQEEKQNASVDHPFLLGPTVAMLASASMKISCYNCGGADHSGEDCSALPGMVRPDTSYKLGSDGAAPFIVDE